MNFLKKYFSLSSLIISVIFLVYTFYRAEIYWRGTYDEYYFDYYIISFILIIFSITTFFINDTTKEYLIIILTSIIFSLYIFEIYTINLKQIIYFQKSGKKFDTRTKIEVYKDLKKINKNIEVVITPTAYLSENNPKLFPLSGISNSKTLNCNENGYYSIYVSDRYGFNNPDNEWENSQIEYLLVGDSYTHNACVNRPHDISSVLRKLSKKPVLNLAYGGNGPLMEYATLREYLFKSVNKVLWIYYEGNDLLDLKTELENNLLINYIDDSSFSQNLKLKQKQIDKLSRLKTKNLEEKLENKISYKLLKFIKLYNVRNIINPQRQKQIPTPKEFLKIMKLTKELVSNNNSKLYFIYLPTYGRYKHTKEDYNYEFIKNIVNELNIPFIDIHYDVFDKDPNPLKYFPFELPGGHYNVEGYKKVAESIYEFTKN